MRTLTRPLFISIALLTSWFLVHCLLVTTDGLMDELQPADCLVVLGNTVHSDGSLSPRLKARLDKAFDLYQTGMGPVVFVSGGLGKEGHYEGTAMQQYLIDRGIPPAAILVDNAGDNTLATARNFAVVAQQRKFQSVMVVSQFFHLTRTKLMLRQQAVPEVYAAHADYYELRDGYALFREFFAYYSYRLFGA